MQLNPSQIMNPSSVSVRRRELAERLRNMSDSFNSVGHDYSDVLLDAANELLRIQERCVCAIAAGGYFQWLT